jgi:hypothetical protein
MRMILFSRGFIANAPSNVYRCDVSQRKLSVKVTRSGEVREPLIWAWEPEDQVTPREFSVAIVVSWWIRISILKLRA